MKYIVDGVEKTRIELKEMMLSEEYEDYCFELIGVDADRIYIRTYEYGTYC